MTEQPEMPVFSEHKLVLEFDAVKCNLTKSTPKSWISAHSAVSGVSNTVHAQGRTCDFVGLLP